MISAFYATYRDGMSDLRGAGSRPTPSAHNRARRVRFWTESIIAGVALGLAVLTLVWRDWVEGLFGVDPDSHSGAAEWLVVVVLLLVALIVGTAATVEWRRLHFLRQAVLDRTA